MFQINKLAVVLAATIMLTACDGQPAQPNSDQVQRQQQEQLSLQAAQSVGMPAIVNFNEKRQLKEIFELRDAAISTVTYTQDMNGKLHKLCDSVGFGIPYATQFTNPSRTERHGSQYDGGNVVLPQADPNGLFSPAAADGTWVLCVNPKTGKAAPLYVEPHVIVSPFELEVK
jgi:hypothetical protein